MGGLFAGEDVAAMLWPLIAIGPPKDWPFLNPLCLCFSTVMRVVAVWCFYIVRPLFVGGREKEEPLPARPAVPEPITVRTDPFLFFFFFFLSRGRRLCK